MGLKYTVYANCQGLALAKILNSSQEFNKKYQFVPIRQIQQFDNNYLEKIIEEVIPEVDLFIFQPISGNYRNDERYSAESMIRLLKKDCKYISFPSCYFKGYNPELINLKDKKQKLEMVFKKNKNFLPVLVHDINIIRGFLANKSIEEVANYLVIDNFYNQKNLEENLNNSFFELEKRENKFAVDVKISEFIKDEYKRKRLFNTFTHPAQYLLKYIALKVLGILSLKSSENVKVDPLGMTVFPIYASVYKQLGLEFNNNLIYKIKNYTFSLEEVISQYFSYYQTIDKKILELNDKQNLSWREIKKYQFKQVNINNSVWGYRKSAEVAWQKGNLEEALKILKEGKEKFNSHPAIYIGIGNILESQGDNTGAITHYRYVINQEPKLRPWLYDKVIQLLMKEDCLEDVFLCLKAGLKLFPDKKFYFGKWSSLFKSLQSI